jgi:hypothetical protein
MTRGRRSFRGGFPKPELGKQRTAKQQKSAGWVNIVVGQSRAKRTINRARRS